MVCACVFVRVRACVPALHFHSQWGGGTAGYSLDRVATLHIYSDFGPLLAAVKWGGGPIIFSIHFAFNIEFNI